MAGVPLRRNGAETAPDSAFFAARLAEIAGVTPVPSPCVNICRIDPATDVCEGCRRTLAEIAAWSSLDSDDKRRIWQLLPGREPGRG